MNDPKLTQQVDLDASATFDSPISIESKKLDHAQKNADVQNRIALDRNRMAVIIVGIALILLIGLTINRDREKDNYVNDIRNDKTVDFIIRQELIKEVEDEFHKESISTFYNILIGATAYLLGVATKTSKK